MKPGVKSGTKSPPRPLKREALTPKRYLGLELAGAKNQKTALAAIEYYPREHKTFLLDVYDRISPHDTQSTDEALLEAIEELRGGPHEVALMGVNVPLTLPPCVECTRRVCPQVARCTVPAVKWMRELSKKAARSNRASVRGENEISGEKPKAKEFTPYTQRPSELWVRYQTLTSLEPHARFEVDEALGGTKAPLTLRMRFLKRHLKDLPLIEAWPKLSVSLLAQELRLPKRLLFSYRKLEEGALARQEILEKLSSEHGVFIYERDLRKLSQSLPAFDAFFCAYTALLSDNDRCARVPASFPDPDGWVHHPQLESKAR